AGKSEPSRPENGVKSCNKAVRARKKWASKGLRPQNRHLKPWGPENPPPKSPGRPRTAELLREFGWYVATHPEELEEYFSGRTGKARMTHFLDLLLERDPGLYVRYLIGPPPRYPVGD